MGATRLDGVRLPDATTESAMTTREDGERTTGLWAPVSMALAPAWSVIDPAAVLVVFVLVGIGLILYAARRPARRGSRGESVPPPFLGDGGDPGSFDGGGLDGGGLDGGGLGGGLDGGGLGGGGLGGGAGFG